MFISAAKALENPQFSDLVSEMKKDQQELGEKIDQIGKPDADVTSSDN